MTTRMLSSTFGTTFFDTGAVAPNLVAPVSPSLEFLSGANKFGTDIHDDVFHELSPGVIQNAGTYITYDQHDLRDFLEEGKAMKNAMINIQRMKETPIASICYNVPPNRGIYETIIVTNASLDMSPGAIGSTSSLFQAGFDSRFTGRNRGKLDDMREILYCERRLYMQNRAQEFTSPDSMGAMTGGPNTSGAVTRWIGQFDLIDRTVTGQADMVLGPNLQIIRMIEVDIQDRSNQLETTAVPPEPGLEVSLQEFRVQIAMPALQVNIIGEVGELTATQKATEYTNVFLSNQNLP